MQQPRAALHNAAVPPLSASAWQHTAFDSISACVKHACVSLRQACSSQLACVFQSSAGSSLWTAAGGATDTVNLVRWSKSGKSIKAAHTPQLDIRAIWTQVRPQNASVSASELCGPLGCLVVAPTERICHAQLWQQRSRLDTHWVGAERAVQG